MKLGIATTSPLGSAINDQFHSNVEPRFAMIPTRFHIVLALCFASASLHAATLVGNFWHNPTFESGTDLNMATGTPEFWNRGGSDGAILQPSTANSVSPTHSLAIIKPVPGPFGEWYSDMSIVGIAGFGDMLDLHWHEMYSITGGEMRVTVRFLDAGGNGPDNHFVVTGDSGGWSGSIAGSTFTERNEQLMVNQPDAVTMRIQLVSGGGDSTTGTYLIDDFSVVPEPSTVTTLWIGAVLGISTSRRRRMPAH